jgi:anti-anti-sigma regulatory factor
LNNSKRVDRRECPRPADGPVVASHAIVPLLKIRRTVDRTVVFTVSGRLDAENVSEVCQLIEAEPAGGVMVLDLTDLVLADRDAIRHLRDYETGGRIVLRNCPAYIRDWMAADDNH